VPVPDGTRESVSRSSILPEHGEGKRLLRSPFSSWSRSEPMPARRGAWPSEPSARLSVFLARRWSSPFSLYLDGVRETLKSADCRERQSCPISTGRAGDALRGSEQQSRSGGAGVARALAISTREAHPALILVSPEPRRLLRAWSFVHDPRSRRLRAHRDRLNDTPPPRWRRRLFVRARSSPPREDPPSTSFSDSSRKLRQPRLVALMKRRLDSSQEDADTRLEAMLQSHSAKTAGELARSIVTSPQPRRTPPPTRDSTRS